MAMIAPSILSANFASLGEQCNLVSRFGADFLHIDVMDGHFVPNITIGPDVVRSLLTIGSAPFDIHLMIEDPDKYIDRFVSRKTEYITVHQEACPHLHRTISHIKSTGTKAGVSINPATPVSALDSIIDEIDLVLIMSVNPGFGGQSFIESSVRKIEELVKLREERKLNFLIEVDGGINLELAVKLKELGVDILVAGSAIFGEEDVPKTVQEFKEALQ